MDKLVYALILLALIAAFVPLVIDQFVAVAVVGFVARHQRGGAMIPRRLDSDRGTLTTLHADCSYMAQQHRLRRCGAPV